MAKDAQPVKECRNLWGFVGIRKFFPFVATHGEVRSNIVVINGDKLDYQAFRATSQSIKHVCRRSRVCDPSLPLTKGFAESKPCSCRECKPACETNRHRLDTAGKRVSQRWKKSRRKPDRRRANAGASLKQ